MGQLKSVESIESIEFIQNELNSLDPNDSIVSIDFNWYEFELNKSVTVLVVFCLVSVFVFINLN